MGGMRLCEIDGCATKHYVRGLCQKHHQRWLRHGDPLTVWPKGWAGGLAPRPCAVEGCDDRHLANGYCRRHYMHHRKYGDPVVSARRSIEERFFAKVEVGPRFAGTPCLIWTGARVTGSRGYGRFGVSGKDVKAHRWLYEHWVGPIPEGLELDHLCRNPPCVNPAHLEPVTGAENSRRARQTLLVRAAVWPGVVPPVG